MNHLSTVRVSCYQFFADSNSFGMASLVEKMSDEEHFWSGGELRKCLFVPPSEVCKIARNVFGRYVGPRESRASRSSSING
jgi:hypothetical protein